MAVLAVVTAVGAVITLITTTRAWSIGTARALGTGLTLFISGGLFFAFLWFWSANVRLLIGQGAVGYRNILRRNFFWSRGEIDRAVEMAVSYGWTSQGQPAIYFFGLDGRRVLVLTSLAWHRQDLKDFVDAAGVQLDSRVAPINIRDARREFPNAFS